ncbi:Protein SEY1-like protein 2 [Entamoeba marina]
MSVSPLSPHNRSSFNNSLDFEPKTPHERVFKHYASIVAPQQIQSPPPEEGLQIIDGDGNFAITDTREHLSLNNYIHSKPAFLKRDMDYNAVGILGAQSSGKSTLLNHLFSTHFRILNESIGRTRTTHGIWMSVTGSESNVVVFDLEGTDGSAREDDYSFERKTSLFSLSVCSVLMVNLWSHDVGRFQASNMSLLKTVFELNLQLFVKEESPKTLIVFVIRDREPDTPFEQLERAVMEDIMRIWDTVIPPEQFANSSVNRFFDFQFVSLPHYEHFYGDFVQEVQQLRKRFDASSDETFFLPQYNKEIPADGLSCFCEQIWDTIKENKELDLPSQREMLSRYRCNEISKQISKDFEESVKAYKDQLKVGEPIKDFKIIFAKVINKMIEQYKESTQRYTENIVEEIESTLLKSLQSSIESLFDNQMTLMEKIMLKEAEKQYSIIRNGYASLHNKREFNPVKYQKYSREASRYKAVFEKDWKKQFDESVPKFLIDKTKERNETMLKELTLLHGHTIVQMTEVMKEHFNDYIQAILRPKILPYLDACQKDMWSKIRNVVNTTFSSNYNKLEQGYETCGNMTKDRINEIVTENKNLMINFIYDMVIKRKAELHYLLEKRFNSLFRFDKKGLPKKWNPNDDVNSLYFTARDEVEEIFDVWCYFRIEADDDEFKFTKYEEEDSDSLTSLNELPMNADENKVILNHQERIKLLDELNIIFEKGYLTALREKENSEVKYQIPLYLVVLLVFFGFDEALAIFMNPLLFLLTLVIGGVVYVGYKLNLGGVATAYLNHLFTLSVSSAVDFLRSIPLLRPLMNFFFPQHLDDETNEENKEKDLNPPK